MKTTKTMKSVDVTVWVLLLVVFASVAAAQTTVTTKAKSFPTTEEAVNALIEAADKFDETALLNILGAESYDITHTGEPARDREVAKKFADEARVKNRWKAIGRSGYTSTSGAVAITRFKIQDP